MARFPSTLALVLAAAVGGALLYGVSAQAQTFAVPDRCCWPPKPSTMVTICGEQLLQPGQSLAVYSVPAGKTLVVTEARVRGGGGPVLSLLEDLGGTLTLKRSIIEICSGSNSEPPAVSGAAGIGATFSSGSVVTLLSSANAIARYEIIGYLAAP